MNVGLTLHRLDGNRVQDYGDISLPAGEIMLPLRLPATLPAGMYFLRILTPNGQQSLPLVIQR